MFDAKRTKVQMRKKAKIMIQRRDVDVVVVAVVRDGVCDKSQVTPWIALDYNHQLYFLNGAKTTRTTNFNVVDDTEDEYRHPTPWPEKNVSLLTNSSVSLPWLDGSSGWAAVYGA